MTLAFMRALRDGDFDTAEREVGASVPVDLPHGLRHFLEYRIPSLEADPTTRRWLGRSMIRTDATGARAVIGTLGFHGPPDEEGRVEIGYRIEPAYRRQGLTTEAVAALLDWAETQDVHRFRASVAPDNVASLAIVRSFGFRQVGSQIDEIDGLELVFEMDRVADGVGTDPDPRPPAMR